MKKEITVRAKNADNEKTTTINAVLNGPWWVSNEDYNAALLAVGANPVDELEAVGEEMKAVSAWDNFRN